MEDEEVPRSKTRLNSRRYAASLRIIIFEREIGWYPADVADRAFQTTWINYYYNEEVQPRLAAQPSYGFDDDVCLDPRLNHTVKYLDGRLWTKFVAPPRDPNLGEPERRAVGIDNARIRFELEHRQTCVGCGRDHFTAAENVCGSCRRRLRVERDRVEKEARVLWAMSPEERVQAMYRGEFNLAQLQAWSRLRPEEIPTLDGEFWYIACHTPEVAESTPRPMKEAKKVMSLNPIIQQLQTRLAEIDDEIGGERKQLLTQEHVLQREIAGLELSLQNIRRLIDELPEIPAGLEDERDQVVEMLRIAGIDPEPLVELEIQDASISERAKPAPVHKVPEDDPASQMARKLAQQYQGEITQPDEPPAPKPAEAAVPKAPPAKPKESAAPKAKRTLTHPGIDAVPEHLREMPAAKKGGPLSQRIKAAEGQLLVFNTVEERGQKGKSTVNSELINTEKINMPLSRVKAYMDELAEAKLIQRTGFMRHGEDKATAKSKGRTAVEFAPLGFKAEAPDQPHARKPQSEADRNRPKGQAAPASATGRAEARKRKADKHEVPKTSEIRNGTRLSVAETEVRDWIAAQKEDVWGFREFCKDLNVSQDVARNALKPFLEKGVVKQVAKHDNTQPISATNRNLFQWVKPAADKASEIDKQSRKALSEPVSGGRGGGGPVAGTGRQWEPTNPDWAAFVRLLRRAGATVKKPASASGHIQVEFGGNKTQIPSTPGGNVSRTIMNQKSRMRRLGLDV